MTISPKVVNVVKKRSTCYEHPIRNHNQTKVIDHIIRYLNFFLLMVNWILALYRTRNGWLFLPLYTHTHKQTIIAMSIPKKNVCQLLALYFESIFIINNDDDYNQFFPILLWISFSSIILTIEWTLRKHMIKLSI